MRIGVHCSVRNGFAAAVEEARRLNCQAMQMFSRSPRMWRARTHEPEEFAAFRRAREEAGIHPVAVHSPYLPNLCTSNEELYRRSCEMLHEDLDICARLGAEYLVIHPGAYSPEANRQTGLSRLVQALGRALEETDHSTMVLVENMAGGGRRLGDRFEDLGEVVDRLGGNPRLGICFDTCHALGAGYAVNSSRGADGVVKEFKKYLDLSLIKMFHVNDSKSPLASHRDRHEHLGKGYVGEEGFRSLLGRPEFRNCAGILETPKDSPAADPRNLALLSEWSS